MGPSSCAHMIGYISDSRSEDEVPCLALVFFPGKNFGSMYRLDSGDKDAHKQRLTVFKAGTEIFI